MIINSLGFDPGGVNTAFSVQRSRVHRKRFEFKVLTCGMMQNRIEPLSAANAAKLALRFQREVEGLICRYAPITITVERFQSRGLRGSTSEKINIQVGVILTVAAARRIPVRLITAATWKNRANRLFNLKLAYKQLRIPPHQLDASLIGAYGAALYHGVDPFTLLKFRTVRNKLMDNIELATTDKVLINRRTKR